MKITLNFIIVFFLGILIGVLGSGINSKLYIDDSAFSKLLPLKNLVISENNKKVESQIELYLNQKEKNTDMWLTFMTIISTFFAVFFIYSSFKIDQDIRKIQEISDENKNKKEEINDALEFSIQLEYAMSFIIQSQFQKAIDVLEVLRKESFVWNNSGRRNTCAFFLAHSYFEKGTRDDLAMAVQYINESIQDPTHPFKREIIDKFSELDRIEEGS